jgi:hypothetical protein
MSWKLRRFKFKPSIFKTNATSYKTSVIRAFGDTFTLKNPLKTFKTLQQLSRLGKVYIDRSSQRQTVDSSGSIRSY